jgi:GNAT superfamily N-acetyltransferase
MAPLTDLPLLQRLLRLVRRDPGGASAAAPRPSRRIHIKQLGERDRRRVLRHFLRLEESDRLLRFGSRVSDAQLAEYVNRIDFTRDTVYGVHNRVFRLVAVAHLAFAPRAQLAARVATDKPLVAEFGVSVLKRARGLGIGFKLFERAAVHCRNNDVDTLTMHYLTSNQAMMHIARKAGMQVQRDHGEAEAYLKLLPPTPGSVLQEALEEQAASIDYALKAQARAAAKLFEPARPRPDKEA